ncbi:helix-turn-helix transcriptional regulator [Uliginosibacterium sp. sgz301328]|uniref:helix-turn-helix transcriptional regulator n=1 Tax=Uliginosibacterium sp. sgz301328 TaxID=3243764 RepID=UPI00359E6986
MTNERIRELFSVGPVHASRLLAELKDRMGSSAVRTSAYGPLRVLYGELDNLGKRSPDEYLALLETLPGAHSRGGIETVYDARLDLSVISPQVFSAVFKAIANRLALQMSYKSMGTPTGSQRVVFPHALIRAPRRWHMRAWCTTRQEFRDFTLGRIGRTEVLDELATKDAAEDQGWNSVIDLRIVPHPELSPAQAKMIAEEYFPGTSARKLSVRQCMAPYIIQDLRLSTDAEKQSPPEYQLFLANADTLPPMFTDKST